MTNVNVAEAPVQGIVGIWRIAGVNDKDERVAELFVEREIFVGITCVSKNYIH